MNARGLPLGHEFVGVLGHPDDNECTHREDGSDATYCGEPDYAHEPEDDLDTTSNPCTCPDRWCPVHARCRCGSVLIIDEGDPAFCPACGHDVMPVGACGLDGHP